MSILTKQVGERIQLARKEKKLTQADLADRLGIALSHMSNIECGKSNFSVDILVRLLNELEISADWLLSPDTSFGQSEASAELEKILDGCAAEERQIVLAVAETTAEQLKQLHVRENRHVPGTWNAPEKQPRRKA